MSNTSGDHTRRRHASGTAGAGEAFTRDTHGASYNPLPTDPYYGSVIDYDMIGAPDIPVDVLPPVEPFDPADLPPGWLPPTAFDPTPPALPTGLSVSSGIVVDTDGRSLLELRFTVVQPADLDLYGTWIEYSNQYTYDGEGQINGALWDHPFKVFIPKAATSAQVMGVAGGTVYFVRAYAVDVQANVSGYTAVVSHTTERDAEAPPIPEGLQLVPGYRGFSASWAASSVADLMFNEIRYAPDDGTGLGPDVASWITIRARTNTLFVGGLVGEALYWCQVRAVDLSGNVQTSAAVLTAVDYRSNPEAGWSDVGSVLTTLIGSADIAANSITADHIVAGSLDADDIGAGTLVVRPLEAFAKGIEVRSSTPAPPELGDLLGRWDENGLKIIDPADPLRYMLLNAGELKFTPDGGLTFPAAITPEGIDATEINFGALPGGHNLVLNSSFELAAFQSAPTVLEFTDTTTGAATWAAANRVTALDNVSEATALTMTAPGFA